MKIWNKNFEPKYAKEKTVSNQFLVETQKYAQVMNSVPHILSIKFSKKIKAKCDTSQFKLMNFLDAPNPNPENIKNTILNVSKTKQSYKKSNQMIFDENLKKSSDIFDNQISFIRQNCKDLSRKVQLDFDFVTCQPKTDTQTIRVSNINKKTRPINAKIIHSQTQTQTDQNERQENNDQDKINNKISGIKLMIKNFENVF